MNDIDFTYYVTKKGVQYNVSFDKWLNELFNYFKDKDFYTFMQGMEDLQHDRELIITDNNDNVILKFEALIAYQVYKNETQISITEKVIATLTQGFDKDVNECIEIILKVLKDEGDYEK